MASVNILTKLRETSLLGHIMINAERSMQLTVAKTIKTIQI